LPQRTQSEFVIEPFDKKKHNRTAFSCEHEALVQYLKQQASQDIQRRVAAVFVLTRDGSRIAGYYTLSQYAVRLSSVPDEIIKRFNLPHYQELPATLLGRLARDLDFKGQGIGELLLMAALRQALAQSRLIASMAVITDAKDQKAKAFYASYGFIELPDHFNRLFLPMETVEQLFTSP
jgi:predicted GNAT family N-acyltransferase